MFCRKCGNSLAQNARFCPKCGERVQGEEPSAGMPDGMGEGRLEGSADASAAGEGAMPGGSPDPTKEPSAFDEWWEDKPGRLKVLVIMGALLACGIVVFLVIAFLKAFGELLLCMLVIGGVIAALFIGTKEERLEARKTIVQVIAWIVVAGVIAGVIVMKPDFIANLFHPGAGVRDAYLTQYSRSVTIEDAFEEFFDKGKWDTYKEKGDSYVVFTGSCRYLDERADVKITFKVTGENFVVDSLDVNGAPQNDFMLHALLLKIYEDE